jgi:hypothetical protein
MKSITLDEVKDQFIGEAGTPKRDAYDERLQYDLGIYSNVDQIKEGVIFTYHKDGQLKVLSFSEAKSQNDELIEGGWKHTAAINAAKFIECLFNELGGDEIIEAIYSLDGTTQEFQQ